MKIRRGGIWWAVLVEPTGSQPAHRRPVLVVQDDAFNRSHLATVIVLSLTSNMRLADNKIGKAPKTILEQVNRGLALVLGMVDS